MASRRFFRSAEQRQQRTPRRVVATARVGDQRAQPAQVVHGQPSLWTVAETRAYLQLSSDRAVYRLVHALKDPLPCRHVGAQLRFDQGEVEQWTRRQRQDQGERPTLVMVKGA